MMEVPMISVIVPTYNRCHWLGGALESLFRQETGGDFSYEIVVVDNASSDATKEPSSGWLPTRPCRCGISITRFPEMPLHVIAVWPRRKGNGWRSWTTMNWRRLTGCAVAIAPLWRRVPPLSAARCTSTCPGDSRFARQVRSSNLVPRD